MIEKNIRTAMDTRLEREKHRLSMYAARLEGVSPAKKLAGGYGYVSDADGKAVTTASGRKAGDEIRVFLKDGELLTEVKEVKLLQDNERR